MSPLSRNLITSLPSIQVPSPAADGLGLKRRSAVLSSGFRRLSIKGLLIGGHPLPSLLAESALSPSSSPSSPSSSSLLSSGYAGAGGADGCGMNELDEKD